MMIEKPEWWDSEYIIKEAGNVHLRDDAPEHLKEEFEKFMKKIHS